MAGGGKFRIFIPTHISLTVIHISLIWLCKTCSFSVLPVYCFFSDISGATLDKIVERRLLHASQTRWNCHSHAVYDTFYENNGILPKCLNTIHATQNFDSTTVRKAKGFGYMLVDKDFFFF